MQEIPSRELRNNMGQVLRRVADGESVCITVNGKPIADLTPHVTRRTFVPLREIARLVARVGLDERFERDIQPLNVQHDRRLMEGVADTSIFISVENGAALPDVPVELAVSVMTIAELHIGVLLAGTSEDRARRLETATAVESSFEPLPVTLEVARRYAALGGEARRAGRKPKVIDLLIAATASVAGVPVYTRDRDFERIPRVDVVVI